MPHEISSDARIVNVAKPVRRSPGTCRRTCFTKMKLSILEYMRYLEGSQHSKCVVEGENVVNAGHLILAGKNQEACGPDVISVYGLCLQTSALDSNPHEIQENVISVYGLCLQTSALDSNPHEITGKLAITTSVKFVKMHCSCKAGNSGRCKHVSAFLIKCIREDVETLGNISQTEKNNEVLQYFCNKLPTSAIAKHKEGHREEPIATTSAIAQGNIISRSNQRRAYSYYICHCTRKYNFSQQSLCRNFKSLLPVTLYDAFDNRGNVELAIHTAQHSADWGKSRKYRITGSRCYEIYTYSRNEWKTKSIKYFNPVVINNKFVKHGLQYEHAARDLFIKISNMQVVECGIVIPWANRWLGYSPDGIIMHENKPLYLLEIKCIFAGKTKTIIEAIKEVNYLLEENEQYKLKKQHKYYGQLQMGMAVLNLKNLIIFRMDLEPNY
ncbi:YqaJ-like viral recombinase domain [Popillia japonica]|uniref:YqaJ-like viral recombinase domain n=1 Tax=Popillia japonica TaxID=7064 RepID=A0AAW1KM58_POPJA